MTGAVFVKEAGTWQCMNFSSRKIWVNHSGTWKEPTAVYVRHSGTWKKVYPSDLEQWTAYSYAGSSSQESNSSRIQLESTTQHLALLSGGSVDYAAGPGNTVGNVRGEYARGYGYSWSPVITAGFSEGAVTRIGMTFNADYDGTPETESFKIEVKPRQASSSAVTANLTSGAVVYTMDRTVASWVISDYNAGRLHTGGASSDAIDTWSNYNNLNASSETATCSFAGFTVRIKYKYN